MDQLPINTWYPLDNLVSGALSDQEYQWLANYGSMTKQMKSVDGGHLHINLINADYGSACPDEQRSIDLSETESPYIREVTMAKNNQLWLYGRAVFPEQAVQGDGAAVKSLGTTPLGQLLFSLQAEPRSSIEVAVIDEQNYLFQSLPESLQDASIGKNLLARRSLFQYLDKDILVQEVFLNEHPLYRVSQ